MPYDVQIGPMGLVYWREIGAASGKQGPLPVSELARQSVETLPARFKHAVEHTNLWQAKWARDTPQKENVIQAIVGALWAGALRLQMSTTVKGSSVDAVRSTSSSPRAGRTAHCSRSKPPAGADFSRAPRHSYPSTLGTEQLVQRFYIRVGHYDGDFAEPRLKRVKETIA